MDDNEKLAYCKGFFGTLGLVSENRGRGLDLDEIAERGCWLVAEVEGLRDEVHRLDNILGEMGYWNKEEK